MEKVDQLEIPQLQPSEVVNDILTKGLFKNDSAKIKEWNSYKDLKLKEFKDSLLLGSLTEGKFIYNGLLSQQCQREYIGIQKYDNGDVYLGEWSNNQRQGNGVYLYDVKQNSEGKNIIEMFMGKWNANQREKEGVYVWIEEPKNNNDLLQSNFEAFVGEMTDTEFKRGIYLTKIGNIFYIYYGEFKHGIKHDNKCYFYDNNGTIDRVFRGKIENGVVQEGFFITFHKEDVDDTAYMKFKDGIPAEVSTKEMLGEKLVEQINKECFNFREILYEEDWFTFIYDHCKSAYKLIQKNKMEDFDIDKGFNEIVKNIFSYKEVSLYPKLCVQMSL